MSDLVHRVSGLPTLDSSDPRGVYKTIMDPDLTLPYVAATLKKSIDAYKSIAGFDISQNPGLTATLYNLGNPEARARALKAENDGRKKQGLARGCRKRTIMGGWSTTNCPSCRRFSKPVGFRCCPIHPASRSTR